MPAATDSAQVDRGIAARTRAVRRFTADEVLRMLETGVLCESEPLELLDGELVVMTPQSPTHRSLVVKIHRLLERVYGDGYHIQDHSPVSALPHSLPEPDVAVVRGNPDDFMERLPQASDVALVVEVAASHPHDDRRKGSIYASAGYTTYWLLDVAVRRLEVRSGPTGDGEYASTRLLGEAQEADLPLVGGSLRVMDLLPPGG